MESSSQKPWSDNPNAPQISYSLYFAEKVNFAGFLIGAIFYGMQTHTSTSPRSPGLPIVNVGVIIVLFFRCMGALFSPVNRRKGIKWVLVVHTVAMFSFVTVYTATGLDLQSISYIDNREFPGIDGVLSPGPLGYQFLIYSNVINIVPTLMFQFNNWLADGLLVSPVPTPNCTGVQHNFSQLYRCFVIYSMNYWVIAFPCLMYLASMGTYSNSPQGDHDTILRSPIQQWVSCSPTTRSHNRTLATGVPLPSTLTILTFRSPFRSTSSSLL